MGEASTGATPEQIEAAAKRNHQSGLMLMRKRGGTSLA